MEVISSMLFNTQFVLERIPHVLRFKISHQKVINPSIKVDIENDYYQVKTADTADEMAQVFALRFEVFFREFSTKKVNFSFFPYDIDMHDFLCDHLIVKDKASDKVVACYRLLICSNRKNHRFYSEGEFDLDSLIELEGPKLELGRACVHKDFRSGTVISFLWKGLLDYAKKSNVRYLFGCSSINRKDFHNVPKILKWLEQNDSFIEEANVTAKAEYSLVKHNLDFNIDSADIDKVSTRVLGSLMHMYVMAGAQMGRALAYDEEMDCLDMFTLMDLNDMPSSFVRKFS